MKEDEKALEKHFLDRLDKGDVLTEQELESYVEKQKLKVDTKYINNLRNNLLPTVLYKPQLKIKTYQTISIDRIGLISVDFAYYKKKDKWHNKNCVGFLMVNAVITRLQYAIPMKNRSTSQFEQALEAICKGNHFPFVSVIISDRESVLASKAFQRDIKAKYGVKFQFIHRYNKAWVSESGIRWVKRDLSVKLLKSGGKNWIKHLPAVINEHNDEQIPGTDFAPNQINGSNFMEFINQLHDVNDQTMNFSTNSIDSRSIVSKNWIKILFKFRLGQKVLASRYSLEGRKTFGKSSVDGTYSPEPYIIKRAKLRQTKQKTLVPGMCTNF